MNIQCPHCGQAYIWSPESAGQTIQCEQCRGAFVSPSGPASSPGAQMTRAAQPHWEVVGPATQASYAPAPAYPYQQPIYQQAAPAPQSVSQHVTIHAAPSNGLGVAGFIVSLVGFLTCGLACPIGLLLSLPALAKRPRGFAIAGSVLGFLGTAVLALWGFAFIMALLGLGAASEQMARDLERGLEQQAAEMETQRTASEASEEEPAYLGYDPPSADEQAEREEAGERMDRAKQAYLDEAPEQDAAVETAKVVRPDPPVEAAADLSVDDTMRTWTSTAGTTLEGEFVSMALGKVQLRKRDGKIITVPMDKLSSEDQQFIRSRGR